MEGRIFGTAGDKMIKMINLYTAPLDTCRPVALGLRRSRTSKLSADLGHPTANIEIALGNPMAPRLSPDPGPDPRRPGRRRCHRSAPCPADRSRPHVTDRVAACHPRSTEPDCRSEQNGSEIGEMKPIVPFAPGILPDPGRITRRRCNMLRAARTRAPGGPASLQTSPGPRRRPSRHLPSA